MENLCCLQQTGPVRSFHLYTFCLFFWLFELTVDRANLVAHGKADQIIICVKHHKDLVNAQLLCGRGPPIGIFMRAALKGDGLPPLVGPGFYGALRKGDGVFTVRGGSDHCTETRRGDESKFFLGGEDLSS